MILRKLQFLNREQWNTIVLLLRNIQYSLIPLEKASLFWSHKGIAYETRIVYLSIEAS